jgi:hypothetical protein
MIICNVTYKVENEIFFDWMRWQKEEHIPEIMATGFFEEFRIFHLLEYDDKAGSTYLIQYLTTSTERFLQFRNQFENSFQRDAFSRWGERCTSFQTLMESVQ